MSSAIVTLKTELSVADETGVIWTRAPRPVRFGPGITPFGERLPVTLGASSFTALSVPSGAKLLILVLGTAVSVTLKALTGETGFPLAPASNPLGLDVWLPVSGLTSVGLLNGSTSSQTIEALWL